MRSRIVLAGTAGIGLAALLLTIAMRQPVSPSATPATAASPTTTARVLPAAVQAFADRVVPSFDGVLRVDRKVVVRLRDVARGDSPGIAGATDATWAVAVVGDIRQTWGLLPTPNSQCAIWFVNSVASVVAFQSGATSSCEAYFFGR